MADLATLEVEVDVNEAYIARVTNGQAARITLDAYPDTSFAGAVRQVVPTADRQKATVLVRIAFKELDPRILPDMGVKVTFLREAGTDTAAMPMARAVMLVPQGAVKTENGASYVFLVRENTVERRAVKTGGTDGDRLEVLAGLNGGDRVVMSPPPDLAEGKLIVVKTS
jgi:RND family efflux transporter MFP subunit